MEISTAIRETINEISKIFHSDHPIYAVISDVSHVISDIWNYTFFVTGDKQPIAVSNIVVGIILFSLGLRLARFLSTWVHRKLVYRIKVDASVANSLERLSYYFFIIIIAIFVLDMVNVPLTAFTVVGTTLALGIGLGSQNIVNNFISGLIIMVERPIKHGDIIELKNLNFVGQVTNIGARCVSIRTDDNINVLIPNSNILQDSVINWTLEDKILKTSLPLFIENNSSLDKVDSILLQALANDPQILSVPKPKILVRELIKQGLSIELEFWANIQSEADRKYIINNLNRTIEPLFRKHNINLVDKPK